VSIDRDETEEIDVYNRTLNTALAAPKINVHQLRAKSTLRYKPWSALYGRVTRGRQLSPSAHKDLPLPVTIPLTR
jgi:hypothetical protein